MALSSTVPSESPLKLAADPLKANLLRWPNLFKKPSATSSAEEKYNEKWKGTYLSAAETLILEKQERKRQRIGHDA